MEENRIGGTMKQFRILALVTVASNRVVAIVGGPGIEPGGLRREFSSKTEVHDFVDALNLAFEEGFREATKAHKRNGRRFVTSFGARSDPAVLRLRRAGSR